MKYLDCVELIVEKEKYAKEERVAGYDAPAYDEDKTDRVTTITNSRDNEVKNFTVEKIWKDDDDRDGLRPTSIKVKLLCNSDLVEEVILNEGNEWTYTWKGLEVYGPSATSGVITNDYTVKEVLEAIVPFEEKYQRIWLSFELI